MLEKYTVGTVHNWIIYMMEYVHDWIRDKVTVGGINARQDNDKMAFVHA